MYRRHVLWAEQENAEPIKFLFGNPTTHIRDVGGKIDDLEDFMVVDRGFVYGRQGGYTKHGVLLRTITNPAEVNRYATMFGQLYDRAQNVFQVLDLKITEANGNTDKQKKLSDLKSLCGYIKQKAGNKALYKTRFSEQQRHGRSFFDRVCELIATSKADIIAVDVADKKVSYFYRAWLKHDSYVKFREAGRKSVENGRKLKRLFILENKLEATHEDDIVKFLEAFLEDGATIGFLSKKNASNQFEDQPYSFKYELDFLLGGIPGSSLRLDVRRQQQAYERWMQTRIILEASSPKLAHSVLNCSATNPSLKKCWTGNGI